MDRLRADASAALQNITQADEQLYKCLGALHANLDHVATQVRSNLARQSDSLRMREAWLLKQLELVHADKSEVLTRQRDRLSQAAESLRTCLQNSNCSENQLVDCLDSLTAVNLMPEETPFISFRVDSALLREMISQYGRVVPGYSGHFAEPGRPSACLPRPFEEEDEEGSGMQMAHKPLQSGAVRIPQFGHGRAFVRAWLSHQQQQQQQQQQQAKTGVSSSCASKTDCGESFEILSPFGVSPNVPAPMECREDWLSRDRPAAVAVDKSPIRSIFDDVTRQPNELWLRSSKAARPGPKCEAWSAGEMVSLDDDDEDIDAVVDTEKDVDHAAIVAGVCAAPLAGGDPCKTFEQCCCEDSCLERLLERPVASGGKVDRMLSEWLLSKEAGGGMKLKEEKMEADEEETVEEEEEDDEECRSRNADRVEFWLQRCQPAVNKSSPSITTQNFKLQLLDGEISKWLQRSCEAEGGRPEPQRPLLLPEASSYEQWLCSHLKRKMEVLESGSHPEDVKWLQ